MMDLSIIIPVYNVSSYLEECLNSIIYNQNLTNLKYEVIMVNDGSTDSSLDIIKDYSSKYDNFQYISQNNKGLSGARNTGIKIARGNYIHFLDSDDYLNIEFNNEIQDQILNGDTELILFDAITFYENEKGRLDYYTYGRKKKYGDYFVGYLMLEALFKGKDYYPSACLYFIKNQVIQDNNLIFYEGLNNEDELFTLILFMYVNKVTHIRFPYYIRRVRNKSIMTSMVPIDQINNFYQILKKLDNFYDNYKFCNNQQRKIFIQMMNRIYFYSLRLIQSNHINDKNLINGFKSIGKKFGYFNIKSKLLSILIN